MCKKFNISVSERKIHGALLDSTLLADVYIELLGGRERNFNFQNNNTEIVLLLNVTTEGYASIGFGTSMTDSDIIII